MVTEVSTDRSPTFNLVEGGPFHRLLRAARLAPGRGGLLRVVLVLAAVTWAPLFLLAAAARLRTGHWPAPFLDYALHARFLVAMPAFFVGEVAVGVATRRFIERLVASRFYSGGDGPIAAAVQRASRLRDSAIAEVLLLALSIGLAQTLLWHVAGLERGRHVAGPPSAVALWAGFVALPVYQFLVGRWLWRWIIWCRLLRHVSRLDLRPLATHPDGKGGFGFLAEPAVAMAPFIFGLCAVQAGVWANRAVQESVDVLTFRDDLVLIVVMICVAVLGPLLMFSGHLVRARLVGVRQYSALAIDYSRLFHRRWIEEKEREGLLGAPDIQSLADMANAYATVGKMRVIPFGGRAVIVLVLAAVLPMVPLALLKMSLLDIVRRGGSLLLGGLPG